MPLFQNLSCLALRQVIDGAANVIGFKAGVEGADALVNTLAGHFTDHSQKLTGALHRSHQRAWLALEISMAGESWWNAITSVLVRSEDQAFRRQVRAFLDSTPLAGLPSHGPEFRQQCLRELRAARKSGLLLQGSLNPNELARQAGTFARFGDPQSLLDAEAQTLDQVADELRRADCGTLAHLVALRPAQGLPLLVVAVRYFFRRELETDRELFQGLAFVQLEGLGQSQEAGFASLADALAQHEERLGQLLTEVREVLAETQHVVLDMQAEQQRQGQQVQGIYQAVNRLLDDYRLQRRELTSRDSLSIRGDGERQLVKELVGRYRALPEEQRKQLPALLNGLGKLQVVAGDFDQAQRDFQEAAALVADRRERAELHYNAYRAALERRDWSAALPELLAAADGDASRFTPFPMDKYQPQRILGAGGFGVAFLCKHRNSGIPLVIKALASDDLDRDIAQIFAEARILEELEHPAIIRLRDCDFVDPAGKSRPYLVMDYFDAVTLEEYVQGHGPLSAEEWLALARPVADGLQAAHAKGILHRDVKPANILVQRGAAQTPGAWRVKLIDFGLALRPDSLGATVNTPGRQDRTIMGHSIAGTLDYAAPEQMGGLPGVSVGPQSDVYGFAKTACYALFRTAHPGRRHWINLADPLAELLDDCLAEKPDDRPATFAAVLDRLDLRATPKAAPPEKMPAEPLVVPSPLKHPWVRLFAWIYLGLILGGVFGSAVGATARVAHEWGDYGYYSEYDSDRRLINVAIFAWTVMGGVGAMVGAARKARADRLEYRTETKFMLVAGLAGMIVAGGGMALGTLGLAVSLHTPAAVVLGVAVMGAATGCILGSACSMLTFETAIVGTMVGSIVGAAFGLAMLGYRPSGIGPAVGALLGAIALGVLHRMQVKRAG
jgi:serine/threonine protein kinase